jgi:small ligand-binding sensory domain FIST
LAVLSEKLGEGEPPSLALWFAKGYGERAKPIGTLLQELARGSHGSTVVVGGSAEAGLVGDGAEVQSETFALSVLAVRLPGVRIFPFWSGSLGELPQLDRGGSWAELAASSSQACVLANVTVPLGKGANPQAWCTMLDGALSSDGDSRNCQPTIIGGLTVGHHIFVDGAHRTGGAFGVAMLPDDAGAGFEAVVCQGAVPFGPELKITGVAQDHILTEIDGKNAKKVLEPLLTGPQVPGEGQVMAGIFIDHDNSESSSTSLLGSGKATLSGRPSCIVRPMHAWTPEGHLVLSPITEDLSYAPGMRIQLQCMNKKLALDDLRMRAGYDVMAHSGVPPDAAVVISCGARGSELYGSEGVESNVLRQAWGRDVPTVGYFAGGEIGPVGHRTYMHGFTTSCLLMRTS